MLAGYLNGLAEELGREGRRPIIWGDQLLDATAWPRPNMASSQPNQRTHEVLPQLDKRIVIADWQYDITEPYAPTAEHFMKAGFDTLLCPWDGHRNNEALGAAADQIGAFGFLATTWDHLPDYLREIAKVAGSCWNGAAYERYACTQTETATLLRKAMPNLPEYHNAGWMGREVLEFDRPLRGGHDR